MNKYFVKIAVVLFLVAFAVSACDKEEPDISTVRSDVSTAPVVMEGYVRQPIEIEGKRQEWTFSDRQKSLSKGIIRNEATWYSQVEPLLKAQYGSNYKLIDTVYFTYNNTNYSIKVLRVDRKSEPGKYFYVMIDNLNVQMDTACWAYGDNNSNASTYGRLYSWYAANALASQITMWLPIYQANNPTSPLVPGLNLQQPVTAKLLSRQDVCDIIESDAIGDMPYNGYPITNNMQPAGHGQYSIPLYYYDVFVGGLEGPNQGESIDFSRGLHTLGGFRNTMQQDPIYWGNYWVNGWYALQNQNAFIWLRDQHSSTPPDMPIHYPLEIVYNNDYTYTAYINVESWDKYGYSVRYVFEPLYQ